MGLSAKLGKCKLTKKAALVMPLSPDTPPSFLRFNHETLEQASLTLSHRDPAIRAIANAVGPCNLPTTARFDHLTALVRSIVFQQLSGKAATTIFHRVLALVPDRASATDYLAIEDSVLRSAGLSRQKISYLRDLCNKVTNGTLKLSRIGSRTDIQVERDITQVRGFGRWSAHMFLLFQLRRCDIWPVDDFGIRKAIMRLDKLDDIPSAKNITTRGDAWQPYRSVAAWYLWQSLDAGIPSDFA